MSVTNFKTDLYPFKDTKYAKDLSFLSIYGNGDNKKIKLTTVFTCRNSGIETEEESNRCLINDSKLENNISRARSKIFEYAFCNKWDYFFTGTLDKTKYNRKDLEKYHHDLTLFIRHQREKYNCDIQFLLIPELHEDKESWHMHGFISGIPRAALHQFHVGDKMGKKLALKVLNGDIVFDWIDYHNKFGFCDLEPIKNHEAVSKYVTKYINKSLAESVTELNAHLYYHSRGLKGAEHIKKGTISKNVGFDIIPSSSFTNDYVNVVWYEYNENYLNKLLSCFGNMNITQNIE